MSQFLLPHIGCVVYLRLCPIKRRFLMAFSCIVAANVSHLQSQLRIPNMRLGRERVNTIKTHDLQFQLKTWTVFWTFYDGKSWSTKKITHAIPVPVAFNQKHNRGFMNVMKRYFWCLNAAVPRNSLNVALKGFLAPISRSICQQQWTLKKLDWKNCRTCVTTTFFKSASIFCGSIAYTLV